MPTHEEPLAHAARVFVDRFTRTDVERQRAALVRIARSHTDGFVPAELLPLAEVLSLARAALVEADGQVRLQTGGNSGRRLPQRYLKIASRVSVLLLESPAISNLGRRARCWCRRSSSSSP